MDPIRQHAEEALQRAETQAADPALVSAADQFFVRSHQLKYSYNFTWLGRPIIQYPQDIVAFQEIVFQVKPDIIVETGIAHGGSLVLSASLLALLDLMDGDEGRAVPRRVVGVDIDIREHNRQALDAHPLRDRMELIEGSSIAPEIVARVRECVQPGQRVMVCLDSNHTHEHVLAELEAYADLVTPGSYCIVFDTCVEQLPAGSSPDRPWDPGNSPMTAMEAWLPGHPEFVIDEAVDQKLLISVAPRGYLKRLA